jgi:hypothetical protein
VALIDANRKLIYREEAAQVGMNKVEFYDRRVDRREAKNIASQYPREVGRIIREIIARTEVQRRLTGALDRRATVAPDPQTVERLRNLGYHGARQ